jgi:hypothetical protein
LIDYAATTAATTMMMNFDDRRSQTDRRLDEGRLGATNCRRRGERRNRLRQYEAKPWWLQADYAEEVEPPKLDLPTPPTK